MGCGTSKAVQQVRSGGKKDSIDTAKEESIKIKPDRMSMMSQETVKPGQVNNEFRRLAIPLEQHTEEEGLNDGFDIEAMEGFVAQNPEEQAEYDIVENAMKNHYLFNDLSIENLQKVIGVMDKVEVGSGKTVIEQGDSDANYFYVVSKGELIISIGKSAAMKRNKDSVQTGKAKDKEYGTGSCFGELALLYNTVRNASIITKTASTLWRLDRGMFRKLLLTHSTESKKMNFLRIVPLFRDLSDHTLSQWGRSLDLAHYKPGEKVSLLFHFFHLHN